MVVNVWLCCVQIRVAVVLYRRNGGSVGCGYVLSLLVCMENVCVYGSVCRRGSGGLCMGGGTDVVFMGGQGGGV